MPPAHPHPAAPQEVELKLALGPGALDALLAHPLLAEPPQQQALANTYFDTPQGHLAAGRVAVRLRRLGPRVLQTGKTAGQGGGGLCGHSTRSDCDSVTLHMSSFLSL